jgi:hypothetical protein
MLLRAIAVVSAVALAGCAATTPAPRFSAVSPADPDAPESGTPPAAPALTGPDAKPSPTPTPTPSPHRHDHGGRP